MGGKHEAGQQYHTAKLINQQLAPQIGMGQCMIRGGACAGDGCGVGA